MGRSITRLIRGEQLEKRAGMHGAGRLVLPADVIPREKVQPSSNFKDPSHLRARSLSPWEVEQDGSFTYSHY
jgi:hypothetical protein